jgi:NADH-quinone oxidoreductase subunit M
LQLLTVISVLGIVVAAAYMLKVIQQVLLGPLKDQWRSLPDMTLQELVSLIPLLLVILAIGLYPLLILQFQDGSINALLTHMMDR